MSADTSPSSQKPRQSVPHHLPNGANVINGTSQQYAPVSLRERQQLASSIESFGHGKRAIDIEAPQLYPQTNGDDSHLNNILPHDRPTPRPRLNERPRDPRDHHAPLFTPSASRPPSPYTLNPPIDFDGLSWPSKQSSPSLHGRAQTL